MTRRILAIAGLVVALALPGTVALADDGAMSGCPGMTGAQYGAHVAEMAKLGHLGAEMNPGMHQGYSHMARP